MRVVQAMRLLLPVFLCVGCAAQYVWQHPTATAAGFERDRLQCVYEAKIATANESSQLPRSLEDAIARGIAIGTERGELVSSCLQARGYIQERIVDSNQTPRQPIRPPKVLTEQARTAARTYCNDVFFVQQNVALMAVFNNNLDTCISAREQEL
jgi:hypothetical protein